jgi:opacity protein-like surface antigen
MATLAQSSPLAALITLALLVPSTAHAQDQRFRASFAPAAATISGDAELALGGTFGYRASRHLWFEGDLTWIDAAAGGLRDREVGFGGYATSLASYTGIARGGPVRFGGGTLPGRPGLPDFPGLPILPILAGGISELRASIDGSTLVGTMGVRWELPVETLRFRPYVAGGIGLNNTDQRFRLSTSFIPEIDESASHTGYALSGGVGASVRVAGQLWADMEAKYFRLSQDRDVMRLGGGVAYRF